MIPSSDSIVITNTNIASQSIEDNLPASFFNLNVYEEESHFIIQYIPLSDRCCIDIADNQLINQQAKKIYSKFLKAFIKSELNSVEVADSNNSSLTTIDSPSKVCFFEKASKHLQTLISNSSFNHKQKLFILSELCLMLNTTALSAIQHNIALNLVFSSINWW